MTPRKPSSKPSSLEAMHKEIGLFQLIIDSEDVLIVGLDRRGRIILFNKGCEKVTGYTQEEMLRKSFFTRLIPKDQQKQAQQVFNQLISGEYPSHYIGDLVTKNESHRTIKWTNTILPDKRGVPKEVYAIGLDITDISEIKQAEARYHSLFDSVPIGLFRTTPGAGEILDVNPALVQILGYPDRESLLTVKASSFYIDPTARQRWETMVAQDGVVRGFEAQFRRLDGRLIWVRLSCRAIRDSKGNVLYYEGTLEDITDRKHAQEALAESEERYRLFFENITDVILQIDPNLNLVDVSPSVEKHLGYNRDELIGRPYPQLNLIAPEFLPQTIVNAKRLFSGEPVVPHEYAFLTKDGSRVWGEVSSTMVKRNGKVIALYSVVRNISDRKHAELELQNTNRDLELYASLLRHDLGNDLQVIFSTTEVAQMMITPDAELYEFNEATRAAAERMVRLLDIFGYPDKIVEKKICKLLDRLAKQATKAQPHLTIKVNYSSKIKDLKVTGGRLLPMVFDNLFRNSAQHAGKRPKVKASIAQRNHQVQIDIIDNGPGIPTKLRSKLFERGTSTKGSGLGLNLSKRILEAYGGSIELMKQKERQGAAFRILLPLEER